MCQPLSQEMVDLLLEMLQWDPVERLGFEGIVDYVHHVFETNERIFGEERGVEVRTARS